MVLVDVIFVKVLFVEGVMLNIQEVKDIWKLKNN